MHSQTINSGNTIRFRRWSRVGYAIFNSLTRCVNIGALSASVCDKTLQKLEVNTLTERCFGTKSFNDDESNPTEIDVLLLELNETTNLKSTFEIAAASSAFVINIHPNG